MKRFFCRIMFAFACICCQQVFAGAANTNAPLALTSVLSYENSSKTRDETILILGVYHAPEQFRSEQFSPAHIRATLEAFKPQVIGVESNPEWFANGQFYRATYEAQHISLPWARENKLPVYGIDWIGELKENDYSWRKHVAQVKAAKETLASADSGGTRYQYGLPSWNSLISVRKDSELDFYTINNSETGERNARWIDEGKNKKGSPQEYMEERDNHIADYITAVADKHPRSRIAIVIGAMHKSDLERKLRAKGFKVVGPQEVNRTGVVYPGADYAAEADNYLSATDITSILAEAWDSTAQSGVTRVRSERLLKRLRRLAEEDIDVKNWNAYFSARYKMLIGDFGGAFADFEKLVRESESSRFPYRSYQWRHYLTIQQAALLEMGRIADMKQHREDAVKYYTQLLSSIKIPDYSEDIHSDYLFYVTAHNAIRYLIKTPYSATLEKTDDARESEMTGSAATTEFSAELLKAMNLSRAGKWLEAAILIERILTKEGISENERCEGYIMAASSYAKDKKQVEARLHLKRFNNECTSIASGSWMIREKKQIEEILK